MKTGTSTRSAKGPSRRKNGRRAVDSSRLDFLTGGGEMGSLVRAYDWASTPLGPVEAWPQSLRSAVSILLPSKAQIVLFWGPDLITIYNDGYRPAFGTKHPWALGRPARECWSEVWHVLQPLFEGVMRTGEAFWATDHIFLLERHGYPEETYFDVSYDPVRDESGGVGGVFCIVSETTGRVLGERRLRTLRELALPTLINSDAELCMRSAAVLGQNPKDVPFALFYLLRGAGRGADLVAAAGVLDVQKSAARAWDLSGATPAEQALVGALRMGKTGITFPGYFLRGELPGVAAPDRALVIPLLAGTQAAGVLVAGVSRHLALSGHYRDFFDLVASRISTVMANRRAFEQERQRAEALLELDRAKTAFFSNVSHEFRTPLTLMLGPLEELLAGESEAHEAVREPVAVAHRSARRLLKLVNSLLDFARIEAGRIQARYEPVDLAAYTSELASVFRSTFEKAGLALDVECLVLPEPVYVDREMWEKIVLNLLSNAFKFTFEGSVRVVLKWSGSHVELSVRDTGVGIPAAELSHIFERFHRVQGTPSRTHEGSGIGLALVQGLAKLHGGEVTVESRQRQGTTFTVRIPTGKAHLPAEQISESPPGQGRSARPALFVDEAEHWLPDPMAPFTSEGESVARSAIGELAPIHAHAGPGQNAAKVLVVDDNADIRDYLRRLLAARYRVQTAPDGVTALDLIARELPDLVLTDVMLPRMDGFALLQRLRAEERTRTLPVLMLSARAGEEARVEGLDAGADDYLIKPFSARELLARVEAHLKLSQMRVQWERERAAMAKEIFDRRAGEQAVLYQFTDRLHRAESLTEIYEAALDAIIEALQCQRASILLCDSEGVMRFVGWRDLSEAYRQAVEGHSPWPQGQTDPPPVLVEDVARAELPQALKSVVQQEGIGALAFFPLTFEGKLLGKFMAYYDAPRALSTEALNLGLTIARQLAFGIEQKRGAERLEQAVAERTASLREAVQQMEEFSYTVSHDLRAPLRAMHSYSQALLEDFGATLVPEARHYLERVLENARRLDRMILDVLTFSRMARADLRLEPVCLEPLARELVEHYPNLQPPEADVQIHCPDQVLGHQASLIQVLSNLLDNAVKFVRPGDIPRIRIRTERDGLCVRVWVEDNGIGVDPRYQHRLFRMFERVHPNLQYDGTGVGLAIVRKAAERMGGAVGLVSDGRQGSRFWLELRAADPLPSPNTAATE